MNNDLKESMMIVANRNMNEYEILRRTSIEDFLIKYKIFVDELDYERQQVEKIKTKK